MGMKEEEEEEEEEEDIVEMEEVSADEELMQEGSTDVSLLKLFVSPWTGVGGTDAVMQSVVPVYQIRIRLWESSENVYTQVRQTVYPCP
jgi:hypothetical protein